MLVPVALLLLVVVVDDVDVSSPPQQSNPQMAHGKRLSVSTFPLLLFFFSC